MSGNAIDSTSEELLNLIPTAIPAVENHPLPHETLAAHFQAQVILEGTVKRRNTGGYIVVVAGYNAFMPSSHSDVSLAAVPEAEDSLIGSTVFVLILEIKADPWQLVVSRRRARQLLAAQRLEAEETDKRERAAAYARRVEEFGQLSVGTIVEGVVDYHSSLFSGVRAGSLILRVSRDEWSWGSSSLPEPGAQVQVVITELSSEKLQARASRRLLLPNPWDTVAERYSFGAALLGQVTTLAKFGVFLELESGVSALLHRSKIGAGLAADQDIAAFFQRGDRVPLVVESVDVEGKKIGVELTVPLEQWLQLREMQEETRQAQHQIIQLQEQLTVITAQAADVLATKNADVIRLTELQAQAEEQAAAIAHLLTQAERLSAERDKAQTQVAATQQLAKQQQELNEVLRRRIIVDKNQSSHHAATQAVESADLNRQLRELRSLHQQAQQKIQELEQAAAHLKTASIGRGNDGSSTPLYQQLRLASFHQCGSHGDSSYYCLLPYLPKNAPVTANTEQEHNRRLLYQFKDGGDPSGAIATRLALALLRCFSPTDLQGLTLAVIPASTRDKNHIRFRSFCQTLCSLTGLQNGFAAIVPAWDRATMKGVAGGNKTENLSYDSSLIRGRRILLFDDVMTSGGSFAQNATQLRQQGAQAVMGLFLMRTVDRREYS